jgi:hypothetical protein
LCVWLRAGLGVGVSNDVAWDADTYVTIERLLFDVDYALRRMMGWSTRPRVPEPSLEALTRAWSIGLDMARVLNEEKARLAQAKVARDLGSGTSS